MKATMQSRLAVAAMAAVLSLQAAQGMAQQANTQTPAAVKRVIVVSLQDRKLALLEDGKVVKVFPVAVGKPSTPSPVGAFTIERRVMNPTYSHDGRTVPPGPNNPVGTRWMGLSIRGYGIHGTNAPGSIGKAASHGCIRMGKADLEELYAEVEVGDSVELIGTRNEETAQLFGDGPKPMAAPAQPAVQTVRTNPAPSPATAQPANAASVVASLSSAARAALANVEVAGSM